MSGPKNSRKLGKCPPSADGATTSSRQDNLADLRRAVGPYKWRKDWILDRMSDGMTEEMASMLALVVFEAYEF